MCSFILLSFELINLFLYGFHSWAWLKKSFFTQMHEHIILYFLSLLLSFYLSHAFLTLKLIFVYTVMQRSFIYF